MGMIIVLKQRQPACLLAVYRANNGDYGPLGEILAQRCTTTSGS